MKLALRVTPNDEFGDGPTIAFIDIDADYKKFLLDARDRFVPNEDDDWSRDFIATTLIDFTPEYKNFEDVVPDNRAWCRLPNMYSMPKETDARIDFAECHIGAHGVWWSVREKHCNYSCETALIPWDVILEDK